MSPQQLLALTDNEIATYASGGYGPKMRNEFMVLARKALLALAKADAKDEILRGPFGGSTPGVVDKLPSNFDPVQA